MNYYRLFLLFCLLLSNLFFAQEITVGVGGAYSLNGAHFPVASVTIGDEYSYSQAIYTKAEIDAIVSGLGGNQITKLSFEYGGGLHAGEFDEWDIYIGHTSKTTFANTSDWVDFADLQLVFSGSSGVPSCSCSSSPEVFEIELITPFVWNGDDNVVIAVNEKSDGENDYSAYKYSFLDNTVLFTSTDDWDGVIDPSSPGTGVRGGHRPHLTLSFESIPYYWVNGTGNWSDAAGHWATSSGGSDMHSTPPTEDDDVFFDENSDDGSDYSVIIDVGDARCKDMDWTGADDTYVPTFTTDGDSRDIEVYGNLTLCSGLIWDGGASSSDNIYRLRFLGSGTSKIDTKNISGLYWVIFRGTGKSYTLESDLTCSIFDIWFGITVDVLPDGGVVGSDEVDVTVLRSFWDEGTFITRSNNSAVVTLEGSVINYDLGWVGGSETTFHNLTIDLANSNLARNLNTNITVNNNLTLNEGGINLNGRNIALGSSAVIVNETNANRIFGTSGLVTTTRDIGGAWSNETFGNMGLSVTTAVNPGVATISRGHTRQTGLEGNESIERYFIIEPAVNTGLDATLQFSYFDAEVPGGYDEDEFVLYRSTDAGSTWEGKSEESVANTGSNYVELAAIDAFSYWTISDHAAAPLPIQLTHFSATPYEEHVLVSWTTESELNNHYFELERAGEDTQFEIIHSELGAGNSSTTIDYNFRDVQPLEGLSYYLLRQVDFDGQFEEFGPISVYRNVEELVVLAYPNPGDGNVMIQFVSPHKASGMLKVLSTDGKVLVAEELNLSKGTNSFPIQLNHYPKGTYFFVFESKEVEEPLHLKYVKM